MDDECRLFDNYFRDTYGENTNNWPIKVIFELPLIISEREYQCTAPRVLKINAMIHEIFTKYNWRIFPLYKLTEATQYKYTERKDGLHPNKRVMKDMIRILLELIINSFQNQTT